MFRLSQRERKPQITHEWGVCASPGLYLYHCREALEQVAATLSRKLDKEIRILGLHKGQEDIHLSRRPVWDESSVVALVSSDGILVAEVVVHGSMCEATDAHVKLYWSLPVDLRAACAKLFIDLSPVTKVRFYDRSEQEIIPA